MLGIFHSEVVSPPEALLDAGNRSPYPKTTSTALISLFSQLHPSSISLGIGELGHFAYTHENEPFSFPRIFAAKDGIFCLFSGILENLGSIRQHYGLSTTTNEAVMVIEAYKTLRDRAPYPASHVVGHLSGNFAFIIFDKTSSSLFVASDSDGKMPLFWGITSDNFVAFADDAELLKKACGKSLALFPKGCFFSSATGKLVSYENPKNKVTAVLAGEEEICGATFKVEVPSTFARML